MIEKIAQRVRKEMESRELRGLLPTYTVACEEAAKVPDPVLDELTEMQKYRGGIAFGHCTNWFTQITDGAISIATTCGIEATDTRRLAIIGLVTDMLITEKTGKSVEDWAHEKGSSHYVISRS